MRSKDRENTPGQFVVFENIKVAQPRISKDWLPSTDHMFSLAITCLCSQQDLMNCELDSAHSPNIRQFEKSIFFYVAVKLANYPYNFNLLSWHAERRRVD
jgi:hypothetical protein